MPPSTPHDRRAPADADGPSSADDPPRTAPDSSTGRAERTPAVSRRGLLAGVAATTSAGLAGCAGRLPGDATSVDAADRLEDDTLVWDYPAAAVDDGGDGEGIGYAAVRLRALDVAPAAESTTAGLRFRLNSTVGEAGATTSADGYQADWFRFRLGVPRSFDGVAGLRAFVQPPPWPALEVTYGSRANLRELVVAAPTVDGAGTVTVEGRFQSSGAALPRQLRCQFAVQASQSTPFGRTLVAEGTRTFDLSTLALPDGVTLGS